MTEAIQKRQATPKQGTEAPTKKGSTHLLGPISDMMMIGGLSIIFFGAFCIFVPRSASTHDISWLTFYLSFLVNFPHFMASYQLLYWDYRGKIFREKRYFWAGVIAPLLLIGALGWGAYFAGQHGDRRLLGYMANTMFFLVGHHYIKQIFGCMVVSASLKGYFFERVERLTYLVHLGSLWFLSFVTVNRSGQGPWDFWGVSYTSAGISDPFTTAAYVLFGVTLFASVVFLLRRYLKTGQIIPFVSIIPVLSLYVWYLPLFYHPHFFYFIPFFHSLQYLLFSFTLMKNKAYGKAFLENDHAPEKQRRSYLVYLGCVIGFPLLTGALFWDWLPKYLDSQQVFAGVVSVTGGMFLFHIFLNVHHYLIDNVIWRRENSDLKTYLTQPPR